jgi:two-component system, sensor histidine kinase and response regulator
MSDEARAELAGLVKQVERELSLLDFKHNRALRDKHVLSSLLTNTSEDLKQSLDLEKRFIASMSHEIRTPLNSIIGFLDLLGATPINDEQSGFLRSAQVSADHLISLISDILDLSKIEAAQLEVQEEEVAIEDLLLESLAVVANRAKEGVRVVHDVVELDYFVLADPVRIKQIFINLLGNAVKFTTAGRIRLSTLGAEPVGPDKVRLTFGVEDTGIGIPADRIGSIFDSFRQGHGSSYGGSGLGLYLSRSMARMMGGDITVQSTEGVGSRFFVHVVLKKGNKKGNKFVFGQKRIMIADRALSGDTIPANLREQGAVVIETEFAKAIDVIKACGSTEWPVDVLVVDVDALGRSAHDLAALLKDAYPSMLIIGTTETKERRCSGPFDGFLGRPCTYYRLAKLMNELIERSMETEETTRFREMKVLIAEDVEVNILLAESMFEKYFGIRVDIARDGIEAVRKVVENPYDVVFMDIQMPNMDGIAAAQAIREKGIMVPMAAMTADAFSDSVERAQAAGMDHYVTKPIKREHLVRILEKVHRTHQVQPVL